ncbi:MAG: hypothetical protein MZV70_14255 [Desulfobacterales bacterium]|nr:hypothetical protein [Desulfobacterales bacterium]
MSRRSRAAGRVALSRLPRPSVRRSRPPARDHPGQARSALRQALMPRRCSLRRTPAERNTSGRRAARRLPVRSSCYRLSLPR